jgi:hypothetical protein
MFVGLVALGPKKLPEAVQVFSRSLMWLKKQTTKTKQRISKSFGLNEAYQDSRNEKILKDLENSEK